VVGIALVLTWAAPAIAVASQSIAVSRAETVDPSKGDEDTTYRDTPWGPLSQYDRNLLINVRLANLWEGPTSEKIAQRTSNPKVRSVAEQLSREHHELDAVVIDTADRLNVPLNDSPAPLQKNWMDKILSAGGMQADDVWANVTRQAHGTIFLLIADVRARTRNDVMRTFAQAANEVVQRHMTLLESTGLVRSSSLVVGSEDPAPHQTLPNRNELIRGILITFLALIATLATIRICSRYEPATAIEIGNQGHLS
jgi:putative membrane protein